MRGVYHEILVTRVPHSARICNVDSVMFFDRKVEMVSFELGEELRKMFFRLVTSVEQRKLLSPHEESRLRPSDLRSDVLQLSHKDSSVSGVALRYRHCRS